MAEALAVIFLHAHLGLHEEDERQHKHQQAVSGRAPSLSFGDR